ncbi:Alpha/Beta hydrolase protein [Xylogone sp. PMI_703]|nr:Alpha/Beta hydrolase protein [Xylogone sp. PMI_703]
MSGKRLALDDTELFYTIEGSGIPVLLIHGWTCDQNDWTFQIPLLTSLGFCVIGFDLRGHGRSTFKDNSAFDPLTLANDAVALLSHLGIGQDNKTIIVGHSLGGVVANEIAFRYPEYVRGIVLVDPAYEMTAEALHQTSQLLKKDIENSPQIVTDFWDEANIYPANTPVWLRPWQRRRAWGMNPHVLTACFNQLASFLGQSGVAYLSKTRNREIPRLVTCALDTSIEIEEEAGINRLFDTVELIPAGHFHFMVEAHQFNSILKDWLVKWRFVDGWEGKA